MIETMKSQQDRKLSYVARSGKIGIAILGSQNSSTSVEMLSSLGSRLFAIACFATVTALFAESGRIEKETSALLFVPLSFEAMHPVRILRTEDLTMAVAVAVISDVFGAGVCDLQTSFLERRSRASNSPRPQSFYHALVAMEHNL
ncbi:PREDICTED: uncharacterized protein LOC107341134 [Acropora digitifera]|uniref:uncharacterized protein LOC107341134 n=1 Tax=Acropora digitifera TaxID=70779 RepID=UPI00077A952B|nr:PREDICTED: uncharacterized protein LOC107341134 [Acropora digitifera]